jgi:chromosome partitioning protein
MGGIDGVINTRRVRTGDCRAKPRSQDIGNSQGGISKRQISVRVLQKHESDQRSSFSSCKKSIGSSRIETKGRRTCFSSIARTPSLHSETMGKNSCGEGQEKMKTLVTANQKGGVGKTSTLVHLAFDFFERGLKVAVIDLDTQANASYTLQSFRSGLYASELLTNASPNYEQAFAESKGMSLIESDAGLANMEKMTLKDAGNNFRLAVKSLAAVGYDVCLIDTAPSLGITMGAALLAADFVISPIELEAYSIQGIKKMVTTIANIRKANPTLKFLGMVPSKVDSRNPRHGRHLDELNKAYPSLMVPTGIGLRSSIADALASGVPVWKIKKTAARKAAQEVKALAEHVCHAMEIK